MSPTEQRPRKRWRRHGRYTALSSPDCRRGRGREAETRLSIFLPSSLFPPLDNMLRATIGTDAEMVKFRDVFWKVYKG